AAEPCQKRGARPAVKIDGHVIPALAQPATKPEVMQETFETSRPRGHDDFVEVRVMADYRSGRRLDDVGQMRVRETAAQRGNGRCCEDDVPNLAKPDQEDAHPTSVFYGRFVDGHVGNIVLGNGVHALARPALQRLAFLDG